MMPTAAGETGVAGAITVADPGSVLAVTAPATVCGVPATATGAVTTADPRSAAEAPIAQVATGKGEPGVVAGCSWPEFLGSCGKSSIFRMLNLLDCSMGRGTLQLI